MVKSDYGVFGSSNNTNYYLSMQHPQYDLNQNAESTKIVPQEWLVLPRLVRIHAVLQIHVLGHNNVK